MQLSHDLGVPPNPSNPYTITKFGLMHDMLEIIFGNTSVAQAVVQDLRRLDVGIGPGPLCGKEQIYCIDFKTLQQVIVSKREFLSKGGYERIYPSPMGDRYSRFIRHMHRLVQKKLEHSENLRTLWQVHHLSTALEMLYSTR